MKLRILILLLLVLSIPVSASAHSGSTDDSGGHYDRSTGQYHYHHGYPAHQHTDGKCPYNFNNETDYSSGSVSSGNAPAPIVNPSSAVETQKEEKTVPISVFILTSLACVIITYFVSHKFSNVDKAASIRKQMDLLQQINTLKHENQLKTAAVQKAKNEAAQKILEAKDLAFQSEERLKQANTLISEENAKIRSLANKKAAKAVYAIFGQTASSPLFADTAVFSALSSEPSDSLLRRIANAKTDTIEFASPLHVSVDMLSSDGHTIYKVTLDSCTCPDFRHRHIPCKHMIKLALALSTSQNTPKK